VLLRPGASAGIRSGGSKSTPLRWHPGIAPGNAACRTRAGRRPGLRCGGSQGHARLRRCRGLTGDSHPGPRGCGRRTVRAGPRRASPEYPRQGAGYGRRVRSARLAAIRWAASARACPAEGAAVLCPEASRAVAKTDPASTKNRDFSRALSPFPLPPLRKLAVGNTALQALPASDLARPSAASLLGPLASSPGSLDAWAADDLARKRSVESWRDLAAGRKRGVDVECAPTADTMLILRETASSSGPKSLAEAKLGLAASDDAVFGSKAKLYVGPFAAFDGIRRENASKVGAHLTFGEIGAFQLSVAGGLSKAPEAGRGAFGMIEASLRF